MKYTTVLLFASNALAHFRVPFPGERNATNWDTQTIGPCGGANRPVLPRYEWNPQGSPVEIGYHHTYGVGTLFYCGEGDCTDSADFTELLYAPIDQTKGNFCIPALQLPEKFNKLNDTGVIQIVYADPNEKGGYTYMYNCIDVVVSNDGPLFDGQCSNSTGTEISIDEGVAELEASSIVPLDEIETLTYLEAARTATSSAEASGMNGMSGMSGMGGAGGHDHGGNGGHGGMSGMDHSTSHHSGMAMDHTTGHGGMSGMGGMDHHTNDGMSGMQGPTTSESMTTITTATSRPASESTSTTSTAGAARVFATGHLVAAVIAFIF